MSIKSTHPIHVEVRSRYADEPIERMIKRFTKKVKKEGIIAKVLEKRTHEKRSDKKRRLEKRRKKVLDKLKRKNEQKLHK